VKICGLTRPADVAATVDGAADALGFVFHAPSPRNVTPAQARELAAAAPSSMLRVAVVRHPSQVLIDAILADFAPDALQLDLDDIRTLRLPQALTVLPVVRTGGAGSAPLPPRCLYEGMRSGAGERADWDEAARLARRTQLILAGGLDPENVAGAVTAVRPFGVDVSSGVESAPGVKDAERISLFIAAARSVPDAQSIHREQRR
jgi:phosphoribosylanthranilate isomerase